MKRIIPLVLSAMLLACSSVYAAEATAALDFNSAYVWRGITLNDGLVAQPSLDVSAGGFSINVWGNFDIDDYDGALDANNFSEVDLTLSYSFKIQKLDVGVGLIEYLFPYTPAGGLAGTREIYLSLGMPIVGGLTAGLTVYYDVDEVHGYYADLNLGYAMDMGEKLGLEAGAKIAYADEDYAVAYGGEKAGLYDYAVYLSLSYAVTEALNLSATLTATDTLDKDVLHEEAVDKNFIAGIGLAYAF